MSAFDLAFQGLWCLCQEYRLWCSHPVVRGVGTVISNTAHPKEGLLCAGGHSSHLLLASRKAHWGCCSASPKSREQHCLCSISALVCGNAGRTSTLVQAFSEESTSLRLS